MKKGEIAVLKHDKNLKKAPVRNIVISKIYIHVTLVLYMCLLILFL